MNISRAPVVASWFLERTGVPAEVIGDLTEEYRHGRSKVWFWFQGLMAVAFNVVREVIDNKPLTLQAIFTGIGCMVFLSYLVQYPMSLGERFLVSTGAWRQSWLGFRAGEVLTLLISPLATMVSGWLVGRFYSRRKFGIVIAYLFAYWLLRLPEFVRLIPLSIGMERYRHQLFFQSAGVMLTSAGIVLGGLLVDRTQGEIGELLPIDHETTNLS